MKNRRFPYGYEMKNGAIQICKTEINILTDIFNSYINGSNLKDIADNLTFKRIEYLPDEYNWNKSRVKRIIEDRRYLGNGKYPTIVSEEIFNKANSIKQSRCTTKNCVVTAENKPIVYLARCAICGSQLYHMTDSRYVESESWRCKADDCGLNVKMSIAELQREITELLNKAIANPTLIKYSDAEQTEEIQTNVMRLENEIERLLNSADFNKDELQSLILECAAEKYNCDKSTRHITDRLKADFEKSGPLSSFSPKLFENTVSAVMIDKNCSVSLKLKDGNIIGKEDKDGCTDNAG